MILQIRPASVCSTKQMCCGASEEMVFTFLGYAAGWAHLGVLLSAWQHVSCKQGKMGLG